MKKFILVAVVVLVAIVGLTSYNGKSEQKSSGDDRLLAQIKTVKEGNPVIIDPGKKKND